MYKLNSWIKNGKKYQSISSKNYIKTACGGDINTACGNKIY